MKPKSKQKILVVEDEATLRTLLHDTLVMEGFEVIVAESGEDATQLAAEQHPDLAFIDIGLPGFDGWEVCRRLRQNPDLKKTHLVIHTANTKGGVDPRALVELGVKNYMLKPYDPMDVVNLLRSILDG